MEALANTGYRKDEAPTVQASLCNVTHRVLDSPDDTVHKELELLWRDRKESREAVQVDGTQKFEEADTVFRELGEVLVDHVKSWLEHSIQNGRYLGREERLWEIGECVNRYM